MARNRFSVNTEILELLYAYTSGEICQDELDEKVDELANYRQDVLSGVNAYYDGI